MSEHTIKVIAAAAAFAMPLLCLVIAAWTAWRERRR